MTKEKRFKVSIRLDIKDVTSGNEEEFCDTTLNYYNIGEAAVVAIEAGLIELVGQMNDWGVMQVAEKGLGDQLAALGLDSRLSALSAEKAR